MGIHSSLQISFIYRHARKYLASLRLSCHSLRIEVGRYVGTSRLERICEHCTMDAIENEEHFMTICPFYSSNRTNLYRELNNIDHYNWTQCKTTAEKFVYLLHPKNTATTMLIIKYVKSCLEGRKSHTHIIIWYQMSTLNPGLACILHYMMYATLSVHVYYIKYYAI